MNAGGKLHIFEMYSNLTLDIEDPDHLGIHAFVSKIVNFQGNRSMYPKTLPLIISTHPPSNRNPPLPESQLISTRSISYHNDKYTHLTRFLLPLQPSVPGPRPGTICATG